MAGPAPAGDPDDPDALAARLRRSEAALAELAARLDAAERDRDSLVRSTERQATEIAALTARLLGDEPDRAELQARLEILEAELAAIRSDPLWRLVVGLRRALRGLGRRLVGMVRRSG